MVAESKMANAFVPVIERLQFRRPFFTPQLYAAALALPQQPKNECAKSGNFSQRCSSTTSFSHLGADPILMCHDSLTPRRCNKNIQSWAPAQRAWWRHCFQQPLHLITTRMLMTLSHALFALYLIFFASGSNLKSITISNPPSSPHSLSRRNDFARKTHFYHLSAIEY